MKSNRYRESRVKRDARKIIEAYGAYSFMPVTGGYGHSGLFDEVVCLNGYFIGIEYKSHDHLEPTALQKLNAEACRDKGKGITLLIHKDNLDVLNDTLEKIAALEPPSADLNYWPFTDIPEVKLG